MAAVAEPQAPAVIDSSEPARIIALLDAMAVAPKGHTVQLHLHDKEDGLLEHVVRLWCSARGIEITTRHVSSPDLGEYDVINIVGVTVTLFTASKPYIVEPSPGVVITLPPPAERIADVLPLSNTDERVELATDDSAKRMSLLELD